MATAIDSATNDYISSTQTASSAAAPTQQMGQKEFLRLLTTQMQNQDPTKPMDPTSFVTDLTQMSQLEATSSMNASIQAMTNSFQSMQMMQSASLLGKSVQVEGTQMSHTSGEETYFKLDSEQPLTEVKIVLTSPENGLVRTIDFGDVKSGENSVTWDGLADSGIEVPSGVYELTAYGLDEEGEIQSIGTIVPSKIQTLGVNPDGSVKLTLQTGEAVNMSDVREISA